MEFKELHPDELYQSCNPDDFSFDTTEDLEDLPEATTRHGSGSPTLQLCSCPG